MQVRTKRVYDAPADADGFRVLVDRVWPRGLSKARAQVDYWAKDVAPTTELRKWFGHDPSKWDEFRKRYRSELEARSDELRDLTTKAGERRLTLLYGARDRDHNQAIVLKEVLEAMNRASAREAARS